MDNLLDPLVITDLGDMSVFIRDNVCALCFRDLLPQGDSTIECTEHGKILSTGYVHRSVAQRITADRDMMIMELRTDAARRAPTPPVEDTLAELGYG